MKATNTMQWGTINPALLNRLSVTDKLFVGASLVGVLMWTFSPHAVLAQETTSWPFVFEIKNPETAKTAETSSADVVLDGDLPTLDEIIAKTLKQVKDIVESPEAKPVDPRIELMRQYLESKKSPLAPHAEALLSQYHYRLILGISFAESNFCKRNIKPHNCWGIGGGRPEIYADYPAAVSRANNLIQKYFDSGLVNPKLMRNRWVGWQNNNWIIAVEQVTKDLESRGL